MQYAYALGSLGLIALWLGLYRSLRDHELRREMRGVSRLCTLAAGPDRVPIRAGLLASPQSLEPRGADGVRPRELRLLHQRGRDRRGRLRGSRAARRVGAGSRDQAAPRFHALALVVAPVSFAILHFSRRFAIPSTAPSSALLAGAVAAAACRSDLAVSMLAVARSSRPSASCSLRRSSSSSRVGWRADLQLEDGAVRYWRIPGNDERQMRKSRFTE